MGEVSYSGNLGNCFPKYKKLLFASIRIVRIFVINQIIRRKIIMLVTTRDQENNYILWDSFFLKSFKKSFNL